jgi:hypothetical protein
MLAVNGKRTLARRDDNPLSSKRKYVLLLARSDEAALYPFVPGPFGFMRVVTDSTGVEFLVDSFDRPIVSIGRGQVTIATLSGFEPDRPVHVEHSDVVDVGENFRCADFGLRSMDENLSELVLSIEDDGRYNFDETAVEAWGDL